MQDFIEYIIIIIISSSSSSSSSSIICSHSHMKLKQTFKNNQYARCCKNSSRLVKLNIKRKLLKCNSNIYFNKQLMLLRYDYYSFYKKWQQEQGQWYLKEHWVKYTAFRWRLYNIQEDNR